ncbi:uracil-DNA glycosylase [Roseateles cavernae]|uniref:uracil-DNA glycosylase n=1 Tax=Roseateles cavernae TaxID=3153578 RepID=UPI0032E48761
MSWSERQQAMLEAMGLRVWTAPPLAEPEPAVPEPPVPAKVEAPAPVRVASVLPQIVAPAQPATAALPQAPAAAGAVAAMDWTQLREAVAGCRACGLCEGRKHTVFGVGHERAHWMVVGEAPGEQEDLQGEPFVGQAGKLLDSMLRAIGLTRADGPPEQQVFIANTLKCRPPRNRNPEPEELAQCEPYLNRQIALVQPRIILAMGRFAVQSLLRSSEPIGRLRGRVHEYQGVPLIVTYHPAYLLRNLVDKARAWEDLCLAMDVLQRKT